MKRAKLPPGKQRLLDYLGEPYKIKKIDLEDCVYLDLGDYDIEISRGRTLRSSFDIYCWAKKGGYQIVQRHLSVKNDPAKIKEILDDMRRRYRCDTGFIHKVVV